LFGTIKSLDTCHPALSIIKATCLPYLISFENAFK
jgi:hypothetical protein